MADVTIRFNEGALRLLVNSPNVHAAMDRIAAELVQEMKRRAPVSKPPPVYAIEQARAEGRKHRSDRVTNPARFAGDFPLRPSGYLRSSCRAVRQGDGSIIIGAFADYAKYVTGGTVPHEIRSHGDYPLRNRATGQVFGPLVHHPGTRAQPFVWEAAQAVAARHGGRPV